jgi:hypothetical protein
MPLPAFWLLFSFPSLFKAAKRGGFRLPKTIFFRPRPAAARLSVTPRMVPERERKMYQMPRFLSSTYAAVFEKKIFFRCRARGPDFFIPPPLRGRGEANLQESADWVTRK